MLATTRGLPIPLYITVIGVDLAQSTGGSK